MTLSSISLNLSKHWRFLGFWLSLCFGRFLVCLDAAFLFSTRVMTALGWLPNAHRDYDNLIRWESWHRGLIHDFQSIRVHFLFRVFNFRTLRDGNPFYFLTVPKLSYLGEHSKVRKARSLYACWTRMLYHDRLETIETSQSTNSAKTLSKIMLQFFNDHEIQNPGS